MLTTSSKECFVLALNWTNVGTICRLIAEANLKFDLVLIFDSKANIISCLVSFVGWLSVYLGGRVNFCLDFDYISSCYFFTYVLTYVNFIVLLILLMC